MDISKEWLEAQARGLQREIQQMEKDLIAKDGALQAIGKVMERFDELPPKVKKPKKEKVK